jgi:hypothetical protein
VKYIKWPQKYNRPLSLEERQIAERLATDPAERVVSTTQSWHSAVSKPRAHAPLLREEETT